MKSQRLLISMLNKITQELDITIEWFCDDWLAKLSKGNIVHFVYGSNFPLSNSSVWNIMRDKSATSTLLIQNNIPCVEHDFYLNPDKNECEQLKKIQYEKIVYPIVCKDNRGGGGNLVFKINSKKELDSALVEIWKHSRGVVLSPWYNIKFEYRFFMLDDNVLFAYKKNPSKDSWKFNLNSGAHAEEIILEHHIEKVALAQRGVLAINIGVCTVDIIETTDGELKILEINGNISTQYLAQTSDYFYQKSEDVYREIIKKMFLI
jgi:glutathione synthase/RimK-type ligase-like ATP-grasp enzyme